MLPLALGFVQHVIVHAPLLGQRHGQLGTWVNDLEAGAEVVILAVRLAIHILLSVRRGGVGDLCGDLPSLEE